MTTTRADADQRRRGGEGRSRGTPAGQAAADVAQSAFADAFPMWPAIRHPRAWLRRVAERGYYRRGSRETLVESPPERPGVLPTASAVELRDEARTVLASLATLPPKQRPVMAWRIDGYTPAEIAREMGAASRPPPARAGPIRLPAQDPPPDHDQILSHDEPRQDTEGHSS